MGQLDSLGGIIIKYFCSSSVSYPDQLSICVYKYQLFIEYFSIFIKKYKARISFLHTWTIYTKLFLFFLHFIYFVETQYCNESNIFVLDLF